MIYEPSILLKCANSKMQNGRKRIFLISRITSPVLLIRWLIYQLLQAHFM